MYMPQPSHSKDFEILYSEKGLRSHYHKCIHYRKTVNVHTPWLPGFASTYTMQGGHPYWYWTPSSFHDVWANNLLQSSSSSGVARFGQFESPFSGLELLWFDDGQSKGIPIPTEIEELKARSLQTMLPKIRASLSLPNTLYELKDFKRLPATLSRVMKFLKGLPSLASSSRGGKTLRSLLKGTADGYLEYSFNIAPLLSDIAALKTALKDTRKQLKQLKSYAGRRLTSHFVWPLADTYVDRLTSHEQLPMGYSANSLKPVTRQVKYSTRVFHATLDYVYGYHNLSVFDDETAALLDVLGVNLNPAIIWNALPWTFVVDWIIGVNRWLDQFQMRNLEPITYIRQYCWSIHAKRTVTLTCGWDAISGRVDVEEEAFHRQPDQPNFVRAIESSGLSLKEFSLTSALGISRSL
jgi:hypothetical protein